MTRQLFIRLVVSFLFVIWRNDACGGNSYESFETAVKTWQLGDRDCIHLQVAAHERRFTEAHAGRGCEFLELSAGPGTTIYLWHAVTPAVVISELVPSLWIKADRVGIQLQARVIFPRSLDKEGRPLTALVIGDSYTEAQTWRQLRIDDIYRKLQGAAISLRAKPGVTVDEREAYVDRLVLNAYTGVGTNRIWIDDLELAGAVDVANARRDVSQSPPAANPNLTKSSVGPVRPMATGMRGNVLHAGGRPIFVRAVEHQGETFAFLQSLGFNAIVLKSPPTAAQLAEAKRTDVWLISPPPQTDSGAEIHAGHEQVLAWFVGERLTARDAERVNKLILDIRLAETQPQRPILLHVENGLSQYQQEGGVPMFERAVMGTSFDVNNFGPWLNQAALDSRAGSPFWAVIATEQPAELQDQVDRVSPSSHAAFLAEPELVRRLAYDAVARGARGLWFRSRARLDGRDWVTRLRAATSHALNRELELIALWAAAGTATGEKTTSNARVRVLSLQTETARLLIVSRIVSDQQFVASPCSERESISFVVHGMPLSDRAYAVAPQGITPIPVERGGGLQVTLDTVQPITIILLTQDPLAINHVHHVAAEVRGEYATRQLEIAEMLLEETETVDRQLASRRAATPTSEVGLAAARAELRQAVALLDSGDSSHAIQRAARCEDVCRRIRRAHWESAVLSFPSPIASPLCTSFSTLPLHFATADRLSKTPWSTNVLPAGEMEQLEHLLESGWRQEQVNLGKTGSDVRLTLDMPHSGRASLQMRVWGEESGAGHSEGQCPMTILSAPVSVREGQFVRIHGWAKVPRRFPNASDGLMIFDSQTGPVLAERILETQGWREFLLYRVAKTTGELRVVFAHTGVGESWLDDISVTLQEPWQPEPAQQPVRLPSTSRRVGP